MSLPPGNRAGAERLVSLLRNRVRAQNAEEALAYFDKLFPELHAPAIARSAPSELRMTYHLQEFFGFSDVEFLEQCYLRILKREADEEGMAAGLHAMRQGKTPRITMLGRLRYSEAGKRNGVVIYGLKSRYFLSRLSRLPIVGGLFAMLASLDRLARLDLEAGTLSQRVGESEQAAATFQQSLYSRIQHQIEFASVGVDSGAARLTDLLNVEETSLAELLPLPGEALATIAYRLFVNRDPNAGELQAARRVVDLSRGARVVWLGELAEQGEDNAIEKVAGLAEAYRQEGLLTIPVLGSLLRVFRSLGNVARMESLLDFQGGEVVRCERELAAFQAQVQQHYNDSISRFKSELIQAMRDEPSSEQVDEK